MIANTVTVSVSETNDLMKAFCPPLPSPDSVITLTIPVKIINGTKNSIPDLKIPGITLNHESASPCQITISLNISTGIVFAGANISISINEIPPISPKPILNIIVLEKSLLIFFLNNVIATTDNAMYRNTIPVCH